MKECKTPQELYDSIPACKPMALGTSLEERRDHPGHFNFANGTRIQKLPSLSWYQLFNFTRPESELPEAIQQQIIDEK